MRRRTFLIPAAVLLLGLLITPRLPAVTAAYNRTVQIVDSAGNVLGGIASATTASSTMTVQVVNSGGNVLDSLGASTTIYPNTAPTAGQVPVGNAGGTAYTPTTISQDGTLTSAGVLTVTKTNNVAFAASATTNTTNATNITSGTLAIGQGGTGVATGSTGFCMGTSASIAAATTDFIACGEDPGITVIASEANSQSLLPKVCTISNLSVKLTSAANANVPVITVDKNTTGQALTCTVANGQTTCTDVTHSFTTAAGDLLSVKLANPASANATGVAYISYQINC